MQIACTRCDAQHEFPAEKLAEKTVQVRCAQCGHVFGVRHPAPVIDEPASIELDLGDNGTDLAKGETPSSPIVDSATGDDLDTETLAGLDLQEGPRETPDLPAAPPPQRRRSKALPLLLMLLVVTAAFIGYSAVMNPDAFNLFKPENITKLLASDSGSGLTLAEPQKGAYIKIDTATPRFVITGWLKNTSSAPKGPVTVNGSIYKGATKLGTASSVCGTLLTEEQLSTLSPKEITSQLGTAPKTGATVAPGEKIAFMIVFAGPPEGIDKHSVEVVPTSR